MFVSCMQTDSASGVHFPIRPQGAGIGVIGQISGRTAILAPPADTRRSHISVPPRRAMVVALVMEPPLSDAHLASVYEIPRNLDKTASNHFESS